MDNLIILAAALLSVFGAGYACKSKNYILTAVWLFCGIIQGWCLLDHDPAESASLAFVLLMLLAAIIVFMITFTTIHLACHYRERRRDNHCFRQIKKNLK